MMSIAHDEEELIVERRKMANKFTIPQITIITLLGTLLIVGFFHYSSIQTSQKLILGDINAIRIQYVQLKTYMTGQQTQDEEIARVKAELLLLKAALIAKEKMRN
jgi:hypothetical protein